MSKTYEKEISFVPDSDADDETHGEMPFELKGVRYVKPLGKGAQGQVVLVRTATHGLAALKWASVSVRYPRLESHDLIVEARNLLALGEHPHINRMLSHGEKVQGNTRFLYVLLELHSGDLQKWYSDYTNVPEKRTEWLVAGHRVLVQPEAVLRFMAVHVARALDHMQNKGFIHRDVKPANMGLKWDPEKPNEPIILLADLGFARQIADEKGKLVDLKDRDFEPATTWTYAGPRTLEDKPQYYLDDAHTLIFSLVRDFYIRGHHRMFNSMSTEHHRNISNKPKFFQNPSDYIRHKQAFLKETFLSAPDRFMTELAASDRVRPLLPEWLSSVIEGVHEQKDPEAKVDYPNTFERKINLEEKIEPESSNNKRGLSQSSRSPSVVAPSIEAMADGFLGSTPQKKAYDKMVLF